MNKFTGTCQVLDCLILHQARIQGGGGAVVVLSCSERYYKLLYIGLRRGVVSVDY